MIHNEVQYIDNKLFMENVPDKFYDLAIIDPEYGINVSKMKLGKGKRKCIQKNGKYLEVFESGYKNGEWDKQKPDNSFFDEIKRISKNWIIWGSNYFEYVSEMKPFDPLKRDEIDKWIKNRKGWIVWDKLNGDNQFSDCEMAFTSFDIDSFKIEYIWSGMIQGKSIIDGTLQQGNKKLNEKRIHPTQKPVNIYKILLKNFAEPGNIIFDSGVGSGSLRIACYDMGFCFDGCENMFDYWKAQEERFKEHIKQKELFEKDEIQGLIYGSNS